MTATTVSRDHYYALASDIEKERIEAASGLIKDLNATDSADDWKYAVDRLIKGLTSTRASARVGFSLCLGEVLRILISEKKTYSIDRFFEDLHKKLGEKGSNTKGKDLRANLFGRLFGFQALISSQVLQGKKDDILRVFEALIEIASAKSWIRETCFVTIYKSLQTLNIQGDRDILVVLFGMMKKANLILSSEGLLIYLAIPASERKKISKEAGVSQGPNTWKNGNPLDKENLELLSTVLASFAVPLEAVGEDKKGGKKKKANGFWTPTLHFVWTPLIQELASPVGPEDSHKQKKHKHKHHSKTESTITLAEFWQPAIDDQFFKVSASPERKYWGFEIFAAALSVPSLTKDQVSALLSPNLLRSLINQSSKDNRMLHGLAKKTLKQLVDSTLEFKERRIAVVDKLLSTELRFDKLTKTKTVNELLNSSESKQDMLDSIKFLTTFDAKSDQDIINHQIFVADLLLRLVRAKKKDLASDSLMLTDVLDYLVDHAFLIKEDDASRYTERISKVSLERLYSVLSEAMSIQTDIAWPKYVVDRLMEFDSQLGNEVEGYKIRFEVEDEELAQLKKRSVKILTDIGKNEEDASSFTRCFEVLFSIALIELYTGEAESAEILSDLETAYGKAQEKGEEDNTMEVLTDLMLSYVNQRSTLMKKVALTIWNHLIDSVGQGQIDRILDILMTKENKQGQDMLFNGEGEIDEDNEHDHDHSHEEEEESEVEEDNMDTTLDNVNDTGASEAKVANGNKERIEEVEKNTASALSTALGISEDGAEASTEKKESSDDDEADSEAEGSSSDESVSDEEMMALDSTLSQIFKQRRDALQAIEKKSGNQRKIEAQEARQRMIFFKTRLLDLLDSFVTKRPADKLNLNILVILVKLIALTMDKDVGTKASKLVKKITKASIELESEEDALALFKEIQESAQKSKIQAHSNACNHVCIYLTKTIAKQFGKTALDNVLEAYFANFKDWIANPSDKTTPAMFFDLINWANSVRDNKNGYI